jgi:CSLREA domain-containing protein
MQRPSRRELVAVLSTFAAATSFVLPGAAHGATFDVNSLGDSTDTSPGDGACTQPCTLRAAVEESNAHSGDDSINLPAGTYQLTGATGDQNASGDLDVNDAVSSGAVAIIGAGARTTRIVGTGADRVIHLLNATATTTISGVTITGGGGVQQGGGVFAVGTFNLTDAAVTGNHVNESSSNNQGGGIFNGNRMNLLNVTVSVNSGERGLMSSFGPQGGGIFDNGTPGSTLTNVTISGNYLLGTGSQGGGMFYNADPNSTTLRNVTLTRNSVDGVNSEAGGFFVNDDVAFANTIVAGNLANGVASNCVDGTTPQLHSQGGNLEGGTDCGFTAPTDKRNADPLLGGMADNGGQTDTTALGPGSPAIDAAIGCPPPATDQRGIARPQLAACDIGAFEFTPPPPPPPPTGLAAPRLGRSLNVAVVRGRVYVSLPGNAAFASLSVPGVKGRRFVPLTTARQIPMGSLLDTRRGTVRVTTARDATSTKFQSGEFLSGVFQVLQSRRASARGLTDLTLKGSSFRSCRGSARGKRTAVSALSRRVVRRLRSRATGRFRTRGRYSAATVRGTEWDTIDRCDGTLTRVKRGVVVVRDARKRRNITVRAGNSYLARAPG